MPPRYCLRQPQASPRVREAAKAPTGATRCPSQAHDRKRQQSASTRSTMNRHEQLDAVPSRIQVHIRMPQAPTASPSNKEERIPRRPLITIKHIERPSTFLAGKPLQYPHKRDSRRTATETTFVHGIGRHSLKSEALILVQHEAFDVILGQTKLVNHAPGSCLLYQWRLLQPVHSAHITIP